MFKLTVLNGNEIRLNNSEHQFVEYIQYIFGFQELETWERDIIQSLKAEKSMLFSRSCQSRDE